MKRFAAALAIFAIAAVAIFYWLTVPVRLPLAQLANIESGNAEAGQRVFYAGGCESCHAASGAKGEDRLKLAGGLALKTPFGTFHAPNISPNREHGIGAWSGSDFANAMLAGVAPDGSHLYPAFPYTSYSRMTVSDIADLWAFLKTLPAVANANQSHELPFPFGIRRGLGLWKLLYLSRDPVIAVDESNAKLALGRYLVEGPGHCGECHTPRDLLGGPDKAKWLGGGPSPEGKGRIPNITPDRPVSVIGLNRISPLRWKRGLSRISIPLAPRWPMYRKTPPGSRKKTARRLPLI